MLKSIVAITTLMLFYIPSLLASDTLSLLKALSASDTLALSETPSASDTLSVADTLTRKERKEIERERRFREQERKIEIKDSIKHVRDSIRWSQPRILESYAIEDSLRYRRLIIWNHSSWFNKLQMTSPDTTFNENFREYPYMKKDVGVTYLGVSGSAAQTHNYFLRDRLDIFEPFQPYLLYGHTKESLPFYNVKTPYTELAYNGTLFANRDKEESNIKIMHTQNLSPALNINFSYNRYGGVGLLQKESTDNRNLSLTANYLGKRYVAHGGYIYQGIKRAENGGVLNDHMVLDTTLDDSKELEYRLKEAQNQLKRNNFFLTHSYGVPIRWSKNDTLSMGEGTITYFGHSFDYTSYTKKYSDLINESDSVGRAFYNNLFLLSPTESFDSIRVSTLENRVFIRIQPWAKDAILSKLDGGIGHQFMSTYNFKPQFYTQSRSNTNYNNLFLYFGAEGNLKSYFKWEANTKYHLSGYYANNFSFDSKARISFYPNPQGVHLTAGVKLDNRRPGWLSNSYYSNHFQWENNFNNITETKIEGFLEIPKHNLTLFVGYSAINNPVYYGTQSIVAQHNDIVSILSAYIQKSFKLGFLHLDNRVLFQTSSNKEIIPLPEISANLKYYMQFELVKNVLTAQLGADVTFNTSYYAQAYNPALGLFHNQNEREIGNYPYIDVFVNLQWKRASIFVKYINAGQGWPNNDYFSALHYIRPQSAIKFGIHWPFYVK